MKDLHHMFAQATDALCNEVDAVITVDERQQDREPSWLELFNRLGEERVERLMEGFTEPMDLYHAYYEKTGAPWEDSRSSIERL